MSVRSGRRLGGRPDQAARPPDKPLDTPFRDVIGQNHVELTL
jgi:hypothetical protein